MAVAWIGNRETLVERAAEHAAELLASIRCPVISFDTDIHGTRAIIALAERVGAAYDHIEGAALARETALFTDKGGMIVAPGEVRRRADLVVIAGELPAVHDNFVAELAETVPDLSAKNMREFFVIAGRVRASAGLGKVKPVRLSCGDAGLAATLAAIRAQCAARQVATTVSNFRPRSRRISPGDAAGADHRSKPQIARIGPSFAGQRERLGQHTCVDLDDRLSDAHRLCGRET